RRLRCRLRVVRLVVNRDHLRPRADREQALGRGRRERDDAGRASLDRDLAVRGDHGDGERARRRVGTGRTRDGDDECRQRRAGEKDERAKHLEPPFLEGFWVLGSPTGLLTRGSLPRRLPDLAASGFVTGERLPSQRRDRPGFAPGSLTGLLI